MSEIWQLYISLPTKSSVIVASRYEILSELATKYVYKFTTFVRKQMKLWFVYP